MSAHAYVVKAPKPHSRAYNPDRPMSDLVRNQILHLSLAERHLEKRHRSGVDVYSIKTEGEASEYIRHLTAKLHPEGARMPKPGKSAAVRRSKPGKNSRKTKIRRKR